MIRYVKKFLLKLQRLDGKMRLRFMCEDCDAVGRSCRHHLLILLRVVTVSVL